MTELKGGYLARSAAMLCKDPEFHRYLDWSQSVKSGTEIPDGTHTGDSARNLILTACGINNLEELNHNLEAATTFRLITAHFQRWKARQERRQAQSTAIPRQQFIAGRSCSR